MKSCLLILARSLCLPNDLIFDYELFVKWSLSCVRVCVSDAAPEIFNCHSHSKCQFSLSFAFVNWRNLLFSTFFFNGHAVSSCCSARGNVYFCKAMPLTLTTECTLCRVARRHETHDMKWKEDVQNHNYNFFFLFFHFFSPLDVPWSYISYMHLDNSCAAVVAFRGHTNQSHICIYFCRWS